MYLNQVIDFVELTSLREYDVEHDQPLITFPCGHSTVLESADQIVQLHLGYNNNEGQYSLIALPNGPMQTPQCPACKAPITDVQRYGRVLNHISAELNSRKFGIKIARSIRAFHTKVSSFRKDLGELDENSKTRPILEAMKMHVQGITVDMKSLIAKACSAHPAQRTYEKSMAALLRMNKEFEDGAKFFILQYEPNSQILLEVRKLQIECIAPIFRLNYFELLLKKRGIQKKFLLYFSKTIKQIENLATEYQAIALKSHCKKKHIELMYSVAHAYLQLVEVSVLVKKNSDADSKRGCNELEKTCYNNVVSACDTIGAMTLLGDEYRSGVGLIRKQVESLISDSEQLTDAERKMIFDAMAPEIGMRFCLLQDNC